MLAYAEAAIEFMEDRDGPALIVYFSACENPAEYTGRLLWAEREMADMGVSADINVL